MESSIITFDVSGKIIKTSAKTIENGGMFWLVKDILNKFCQRGVTLDNPYKDLGTIFIDRDPKIFMRILNYLRTDYIHINDDEIDIFKKEAEFYKLDKLINYIKFCRK